MSSELATIDQQVPAQQSGARSLTFSDMQGMARAIHRGGLFAQFKSEEQVLSLMLLCQAKNLHPMQAVERYDIIQGRPTMKAAAMQAAFQEQGGRIEWHRSDDEVCDASFSHHAGGTLRVVWDMQKAQNANLTNKQTWKNHPGQMLRARCVSEGVRGVLPGVVIGVYTPDETEDFAAKPAPIYLRESEGTRPPAIPASRVPTPLTEELRAVRSAFKDEASRHGHTLTTLKDAKDLLYRIVGEEEYQPDVPSCWADATTGFEEWAKAHPVEAPAIEADIVGDDDDELVDPFLNQEGATVEY